MSEVVSRVGVSNWGRWGKDDEAGAANLRTPERVVAAVGLVRRGTVVQLGSTVGKRGPISGGRNVTWHITMKVNSAELGSGAAEDLLTMHTHSASHMDGLAHLWYGDALYNGFSPNMTNRGGARKLGVDKTGPMVGRGMLLDVSGFEQWQAGGQITVEHLERALAANNCELESGDIVLVRSGWLDLWTAGDHDAYRSGEPGLSAEAVEWLARRDPSVIGMDNFGVEPLPSAPGQNPRLAHEVFLRDMGVPLLENLDLAALAAETDGPFLFVGSPLRIAQGLGSPINPIAIL